MALTKKSKVKVEEVPVDESAKVDEYLAGVPEPARGTLTQMRAMVKELVPEGTTEKISYGMPTFQYKGGLVGYAAFPGHCGFYPMSPAVVERFNVELSKYKATKGAIRFALDTPLPAVLVKKIVDARIAENSKKKTR